MKLIYIAGPFRGPSAWAIKQNVHAAEQAAAEVITRGLGFPVTPHSIGANFHGHGSDDLWLAGTLELMRRCDVVFALPTWEASQGARGEIEEARRLGIPVVYDLAALARIVRATDVGQQTLGVEGAW
jgi:hypothetical protein